MGTSYGTGGIAAGTISIDAILILFCTIVPNALEPTKTPLKGPYSATPLFLFIYGSLVWVNSSRGEAEWEIDPWFLRATGLIVLVSPN